LSFDHRIGRQIRRRRMVLGLSQQELAYRLGITCQQLQKYENGRSRTAAGRLFMIARILDTTVSYFFEDMRSEGEPVPESPLIEREPFRQHSVKY
jgi:transcriptional regulator with XRE-family HTH domain